MTSDTAFTPEDDDADDGGLPHGVKNYITPAGFERLKAERRQLVQNERPRVVETVAWAAGNGDRSENGDYLYGKKRLREIDRRVRFLTRRIEAAEPVDPALQRNRGQIFFGATVRYARGEEEKTVTIVGIDETTHGEGRISWISPVARALLKARVGDEVAVRTPAGVDHLEVLAISYPA